MLDPQKNPVKFGVFAGASGCVVLLYVAFEFLEGSARHAVIALALADLVITPYFFKRYAR